MRLLMSSVLATALMILCGLGPIQKQGAFWDWQLSEPFDLSVDVQVIDLDPDGVSTDQVQRLNARGVYTICYISVGTRENYRDDADDFPERVMGKVYDAWPNERYLDLRQKEILLPIMRKRFEKCKNMGFRAIEPDNMDLHENETGLNISRSDMLSYAKEIAKLARSMGLEIGQKNAPDLIPELHNHFDWILFESCFHYDFCDEAAPFLKAGKMVLATEYPHKPVNRRKACRYGAESGVKFIFKERELVAGGTAC